MLDVTGPLLPTTVKLFCNLFAQSQRHFTANFGCDDVTSVFNVAMNNSDNIECATAGEPDEASEKFVYRRASLGNTTIQNIVFENDLYRWITTNAVS